VAAQAATVELISISVRFLDVSTLVYSAFLDEIVVPLDGTPQSERAVPMATSIGSSLGAGLRLLTTRADLRDRSPMAYLEGVASRIAMHAAMDVVLDGPPAETISSASASRVGVCMATHARGRVLGAMHPNIAEAVVAAAVGPVFLVGPGCAAGGLRGGPILLAHDGTEQMTSVARPVVRLAAALGRALEVVTIVKPGRTSGQSDLDADRAIQPLLQAATKLGVTAERRLTSAGHVFDGLIDAIVAAAPSLVVMGTHLRSPIERLREGSTTMAVVHSIGVPVLVAHLA
jgi:nucleotide-binding universal stress UspA family protein